MKLCIRILRIFLLLVVGFAFVLELPECQLRVKSFIEKKLEDATHARIHIGKVHCLFPFYAQVEELFIETKEQEPLLSCAKATMLSFPIPLSSCGALIPYLSVQELHTHLPTLTQFFDKGSNKNLFLSIPVLHLKNGETHAPTLPSPYAYSFKGKVKLENQAVQLSGTLYDQTSLFPINTTKGDLLFSHGKAQGSMVCTFKTNSFMAPFRTLSVSIEEDILGACKGSWELISYHSLDTSSINSLHATFQGTFGFNFFQHSFTIDCQNFFIAASLNAKKIFPWMLPDPHVASCTGSCKIQGKLLSRDTLMLEVPHFLFDIEKTRTLLQGSLSAIKQDNACILSSNLNGTVATQKTNSTLTIESKSTLQKNSIDTSFSLSSPFFSIDALWQKYDQKQKGSCSILLKSLPHLLSQDLFKSFSFLASYSSEDQIPYHSTFHLQNLSLPSLSAHTIDAQATCSSLDPLVGSSDLEIKKLAYKNSHLHTAKGHLQCLGSASTGFLYLKGRHLSSPWKLCSAFSLSKKGEILQIDSGLCEGSIGSIPIGITQPLGCSYSADRGLHAIQAEFSVGTEGRLSLNDKHDFDTTSYHLSYEKFPLFIPFLFLTKGNVSGIITGKTTYASSSPLPLFSTQASFALNIPVEHPSFSLHPMQGTLLLTTEKNFMDMAIHLHDTASGETIECCGKLPLTQRPSFPFFCLDKDAEAKAIAKGHVNLALINALFDTPLSFSGNTKGDLSLRGSINHPTFSGDIDLQKGTFVIPALDTSIKDISAQGSFYGQKLEITSFSGKGFPEGSLNGTGAIFFNKDALDWNMNLNLSNLTFVNTACIQSNATGTVTLKGRNNRLVIAGDAFISSGTIDLSKKSPSYATIPITSPTTCSLVQRDRGPKPSHITLDLCIKADNTILIKDRAFETNWSGKSSITGPTNRLFINTEATCTSGTLSFAGKTLAVEPSSFRIHGSFPKNSFLNATAVAPLSQASVRIGIMGPLDKIKVQLRSSPTRSEKEILSLLLFDKEITNISPLESLQLANAAISLERSITGASFFESFKNGLGIDKLSIGSSGLDPNDVSLNVGKMISKGVIVTLSKDITAEANRVGLEVALSQEIKASALIGDDEAAVLSLTWKKEF